MELAAPDSVFEAPIPAGRTSATQSSISSFQRTAGSAPSAICRISNLFYSLHIRSWKPCARTHDWAPDASYPGSPPTTVQSHRYPHVPSKPFRILFFPKSGGIPRPHSSAPSKFRRLRDQASPRRGALEQRAIRGHSVSRLGALTRLDAPKRLRLYF